MSNNEESDEDPDQRSYQDELVHKTALFMFCPRSPGRSAQERPGYKQDRGGERAAGEYFGDVLSVDKQH